MTQFVRPITDLLLGSWFGSPVDPNIYQNIDEVVANDTDVIVTGSITVQTEYRARGSAVTDPNVSTGHVLRWRFAKGGLRQTNVRLTLSQNGITIVVRQINDIGSTFVQDTYTLTAAEANLITNYSLLRFGFVAAFPGPEPDEAECYVSWVELEVPDAPAPPTPPTTTIPADRIVRWEMLRREFVAALVAYRFYLFLGYYEMLLSAQSVGNLDLADSVPAQCAFSMELHSGYSMPLTTFKYVEQSGSLHGVSHRTARGAFGSHVEVYFVSPIDMRLAVEAGAHFVGVASFIMSGSMLGRVMVLFDTPFIMEHCSDFSLPITTALSYKYSGENIGYNYMPHSTAISMDMKIKYGTEGMWQEVKSTLFRGRPVTSEYKLRTLFTLYLQEESTGE